jgi:hypothetical protein
LKNRRELETVLSDYVQTIVLSEEMVQVLCNSEIDQPYLEMLEKFKGILRQAKNFETNECKSMHQMKPEIDRLKLKVCSRARSFLMIKINNLRKPQTNF